MENQSLEDFLQSKGLEIPVYSADQLKSAPDNPPQELNGIPISSFGEQLVGITFNPSGDPKVNMAKALCAELANMVEDNYKGGGSPSYLYNLIKGKALGEILSAQMHVVKLLTLKQ